MRVDTWLWTARLFKTRALGAGAVKGGRVRVDGVAVKPSREVRLGDELEITIGEENGYTSESEAAGLLMGLGVPEELHEQKLEVLQGGDRVRVLLAQALFGSPATLLLDEPTNGLDIASIRWLESFLLAYEGALVDEVPIAETQHVERALALCAGAAKRLRKSSGFERAGWLRRASELLRERAGDFATTISSLASFGR